YGGMMCLSFHLLIMPAVLRSTTIQLEDVMAYILALDQGTTSSRAILFNHDGAVVEVAQREFEQIFPKTGWVEHRPEEIWSSQMSVAVEAPGKASLRPRDIAAVGITNQR